MSLSDKDDSRVLELLKKADWDDITLRLIKYALSKLSFHPLSPLAGRPNKEKAEEMVQDAIIKTIQGAYDTNKNIKKGIRRWDPDKVSLLDFLFGVLKSDIGHLYKDDKDYLMTSRMPAARNKDEDNSVEAEELIKRASAPEPHSINLNPNPQKTPEDIIEEGEIQDSLIKVVEGDDELVDIVTCMLCGFEKPDDIADQTGLDIKVVYNAKKRLNRIYNDILPRKGRRGDGRK
jgi:hypothetical protein